MLQTLTEDADVYEMTRLSAAIDRLETQVRDLQRSRDQSATSMVQLFLPDLTRRVLTGLQTHHPAFLTEDRVALFQQNMRTLGLFKPASHGRTFMLLQAQFKAYLNTTGHFSSVDRQIRELLTRQASLQTQLQLVEREARSRARVSEPRTPLDLALDDLPDVGQVIAATWPTELARANPGSAESSTPSCAPDAGRTVIATDDSLGCFS